MADNTNHIRADILAKLNAQLEKAQEKVNIIQKHIDLLRQAKP